MNVILKLIYGMILVQLLRLYILLVIAQEWMDAVYLKCSLTVFPTTPTLSTPTSQDHYPRFVVPKCIPRAIRKSGVDRCSRLQVVSNIQTDITHEQNYI